MTYHLVSPDITSIISKHIPKTDALQMIFSLAPPFPSLSHAPSVAIQPQATKRAEGARTAECVSGGSSLGRRSFNRWRIGPMNHYQISPSNQWFIINKALLGVLCLLCVYSYSQYPQYWIFILVDEIIS